MYYTEELDSWSDTEKAKKFIEIYWYDKKPIKDLLREDWKPKQFI